MTSELQPEFTFEKFVAGESNRLAVAAARAVAENPGDAYNPLVIHGRAGLGKTHLMTALGHRTRELAPNLIVEYLTSAELVERFNRSVSVGRVDEFRGRLAGKDVVLLDDIHFLTRHGALLSELVRLATEFHREGRQVVMTADRPPNAIPGLDESLVQLAARGLTLGIERPEYETRLGILRHRAEGAAMRFAEGVLEAAAEHEVANVREMLGIYNRLATVQAESGEPLTPPRARAVVAGTTTAASPGTTSSPGEADAPDEFGDFLTDVTATVARQVEAWRERLQHTVRVWAGRGYRTTRLERLLQEEAPTAPEVAVREFEATVHQLRRLEAELAELDRRAARDPVFRDPDRVAEAEARVRQFTEGLEPPPGPSDAFSLDTFVGGRSTEMALGILRAIVADPGSRYNPLVLVGPSGVGKTHLLHALGQAVRGAREEIVACVSAQTFLDEVVTAIEHDAVGSWRARYRRAGAFLLDDIDLISSRDRTQEELLLLINFFNAAERQLVFTSKVPPLEISGLDPRIAAALEAGVVATLDPPDDDVRRAFVQRELAARTAPVEDALVAYLAARPADSLRSVLGTVKRVVAAAEAQSAVPTAALAKRLLEPSVADVNAPSERTSGSISVPGGVMQSREKVVWDWPDPAQLVLEEPT